MLSAIFAAVLVVSLLYPASAAVIKCQDSTNCQDGQICVEQICSNVSSSASPSSSLIQKSINNFGYDCPLQCKDPNEGCYQEYDHFDRYARRAVYIPVCSDTDPCLHGLKTCPPNQHCVTQAIYDFPPFGECFPNGGGPSDPCYNVDCGDGYDCVASPDSDDGYECYYSKYCIEAGCDRWYDICQLSYDNQGNEHAKCVPYRWSHTNKGGK